jgi:hypothetical protein
MIQIFGIEFQSKAEFSEPMKAGKDAVLLTYPKNVKLEDEKMSITLVCYNENAQKEMSMNDTELLEYTKTSYLGTTKPGKMIEKNFLNKKLTGEIVEKKIPVSSILEIFILTLKNRNKIGIGFNYVQSFADEALKIITQIADSLKEI